MVWCVIQILKEAAQEYENLFYKNAAMNFRRVTAPSLHSVLFHEFIVKTANLSVLSMPATYNRYGA